MKSLPKGTCISLNGQRFGRLVVKDTFRRNDATLCRVDCDCGMKGYVVRSASLRAVARGEGTSSCGCFRSELQSKRAIERNCA